MDEQQLEECIRRCLKPLSRCAAKQIKNVMAELGVPIDDYAACIQIETQYFAAAVELFRDTAEEAATVIL